MRARDVLGSEVPAIENSMTRFLLAATFALAFCATPREAQAMNSTATFDGDGHPAVVALLRTADGYWYRPYCSGMLVSGTVVLTASHCLEAGRRFRDAGWQLSVTNDATLAQDANGWLPVDSMTTNVSIDQIVMNPAYDPKVLGGYGHDVSAAVLAAPIALDAAAYGVLPPQGLLDELRARNGLRDARFTVLGYGVQQKSRNGPNKSGWSGERRYGVLGFDALDTRFIHQSQRFHRGDAGACNGDSGGPSLLEVDGTTYVVGVTSSGDMPCYATNTATRTDSAEALELLIETIAAQP